jgi:hypothetical protein
MTTAEIDALLNIVPYQDAEEAALAANGDYEYVAAALPTGFDPSSGVTIECDWYSGPLGKGYQFVVMSQTDVKVLNFGPETWREVAWTSLN